MSLIDISVNHEIEHTPDLKFCLCAVGNLTVDWLHLAPWFAFS